MTTLYEVKIKCPVCKSKFKGHEYGSVFFWHAALLDGCRIEASPPTMCPSCGYVSYDFPKKTKVKIKDLQEDSYTTCDGLIEKLNFDVYDIAKYRNYMLARMDNNYMEMYYSLRKCMHLYGKKLRAELLPEVYALFCKAHEDEIDKEDKKIIAVQLFYLRLLGRFQEAKGILDRIEHENLVDPENRRLLFEFEMIEEHNSEVQDYDDYSSWEMPYLIKIYGAEFDRRFRAVVGEEVPLMYYDEIAGEPWKKGALNYVKFIGMLGDNEVSSVLVDNYLYHLYLDVTINGVSASLAAKREIYKKYDDLMRVYSFEGFSVPKAPEHLRKKYVEDKILSGDSAAIDLWLEEKAVGVLADQQYHQIYHMNEDNLDKTTRDIFKNIRAYYAEKLRARS